ncbi:hypothetical protein [Endozoicomonas sp. YOMI1]|uniref:hypothetical protein n=1 Tax=Endozoicomonas sp. YOMI1 TaxID=2828739 RepID=UPI002148D7CE|nr:hypothetical protein [Endozoicomonas sp. YOMI1]
MEAKLSSDELTQFLREALRMNSAAGNRIVATLFKMGATLPEEEQQQFLRDSLRLGSAAGHNHAVALGIMGATLPREELEQLLREARAKNRRVTASILEGMIAKVQEPA